MFSLDLVVEIAHILARMPQPVLVETFGTFGVVPQESVSETPKRMVPSFMCSGVHVDILQFLRRRMKMATDDVRRRDESSCSSAEQKAFRDLADLHRRTLGSVIDRHDKITQSGVQSRVKRNGADGDHCVF